MEKQGNQFRLVFNLQCGRADKGNDMFFPCKIARHSAAESVNIFYMRYKKQVFLFFLELHFRDQSPVFGLEEAAAEIAQPQRPKVLCWPILKSCFVSIPHHQVLHFGPQLVWRDQITVKYITVKYIPAQLQLTLKLHRGRKADNSDPSSFANGIKQVSIREQNCHELKKRNLILLVRNVLNHFRQCVGVLAQVLTCA